ncbi:MAG: hypothetical protein HY735_35300 [Verrucomicrobia bacterium]|nr:hypothetical protein [Verrucomicrobiota bacterium]
MAPSKTTEIRDTPFVNEVRLSARHWILALGILAAVALLTPALWKRLERFQTGADYRIPYPLSKDYWLYERRLEQMDPTNVVLLGDSVVWGEYVRPDGTLSHFLNDQSGRSGKFVNGGVNGLFPLALEGLIRYYGGPLRHRKVMLHCNVLWMTSPKADLHTEKEERFNHADLVPQFYPRIPCYRADLNQRLGAVVERHFTFAEWATHLQIAYFDQKSILNWTLAQDGGDPARYPNAYKNPLAQITFAIPPEPAGDPERGPGSPRHKPWSATGEGSTRFEWVEPETSLQSAAFKRLVKLLQSRGNDVLVLIGPFNEHIMAGENRPAFRRIRGEITDWLTQNEVACLVPETLPSVLYADASHPLTEGYQMLASRIFSDETFRKWFRAR